MARNRWIVEWNYLTGNREQRQQAVYKCYTE